MNTTFENFKRIFFDGLEPNEYSDQIVRFRKYLDKIHNDFYGEYTYCSGCRSIVKKDESYAVSSHPHQVLIRCNKCNTLWYIRHQDNAGLVE